MSNIKAIRITISVDLEDGGTREHCVIEKVGDKPTECTYPNGHNEKLEAFTVNVLRNAFYDTKLMLKGSKTDVERIEVETPANGVIH